MEIVLVAAVAENRADIGIFGERTPEAGLQTFPYKRDELMLVVPDSHPLATRASVAFAETLEYDYVGLPASTSLASLLAAECTKLDMPMRLRIQVRSFDAICRMVDASEIAYLTAFLASDKAWAITGELVVANGGVGQAVYY